MPEPVITDVNQVTPEWLTRVLTHSGALETGSVESFVIDTDERLLSTSVRLKLTYSAAARGTMPQKLFLKMVDTDQDDEFFGPSEVNYYIRDYVGVADVPLLRCYDAVFSDAIGRYGRYHLLMDDVSTTHIEAASRPPTLEHGLALAEGLASMHAHWWGAQRLKHIDAPLPGADVIRRFVGISEPGARHIINACAEQLKPHWIPALYEVYEKHPQLMIDRTADDTGFTLIHGDTNLLNILVPREGERPIYIIDRQPFDWSLTTWLGVYDLAYTMVLKWEPDLRRALEKPVIQHYHEHLIRRGVTNYSWERLWHDYRLSAVMGIYVATEWCRGGLNTETMPLWMLFLQNSLTAFDDLECSKLWK
jgi:hypothetical protein